jgi:hypothetical protein
MKMMVRRTKALAKASWAFSSMMETFVNPRAYATVEMHFTVNSLPAMGARERPLLNKLCSTVVSCQIFIRSQSLIAR